VLSVIKEYRFVEVGSFTVNSPFKFAHKISLMYIYWVIVFGYVMNFKISDVSSYVLVSRVLLILKALS